MKKQFLTLIVTMCLLPGITSADEPDTIDIEIIDIMLPDVPQTRSGISSVEATAYPYFGYVELIFNKNVGTVTISLSSSSGIETKTCDTSTESVVTLPLADTSGSCQIDISGIFQHLILTTKLR